MSTWSLTPLERARLARRTVEMLAMPELVCEKRVCRRSHICEFFDSKSGERWCLRHLDPEARAVWDELHAIVIKIADQVHVREPSRDPRLRELEEAAIEIVKAVPLHDPVCHLFGNWLKAYRASVSGQPVEKPDGRDAELMLPEGADLDDWRNYR
ncbi:hypothetical protein [Rhizobium sp. LjRoot254]|uniref:hypothetical protein n=1 Tax=Rhizobium sp. LjRoot254 TaxID=3342297 RepID=UPI003ECE7F87